MSLSPGGLSGSVGALPEAGGPLVGRRTELARLDRLLGDPDVHLVTLTGPPGVGKTTLAVAAAAAAADRFPDGTGFVDLTALRNPAAVPGEIAEVLGAGAVDGGGTESLARALAGRRLLLVLDNFEHVLSAAPAVGALLAACPPLQVLVTSRERLHLRSERELPVGPLAVPGPAELADVALLAATPSVDLLVREVRAFEPGFAVTEANRAALAEICVRLDGIPLALELAAPRLRLFSPGELTFRLRNRLGSLSTDALDVPARHRTLQAALSWSHDLLGPEERALFHRLSVFVGGWTLEAAAQVCDVDDPIQLTASLVDKSLIRRTSAGGDGGAASRFTMLESLREFAGELLEHEGAAQPTRARHAAYFAGLAAAIDARIGTPEEKGALEDVGLEVGNVRAALATSLAARDADRTLPLASALGWHSWTRGQLGAGQAVLEEAISAVGDPAAAPADPMAGVLFMSGAVALALGDLALAERRMTASLAITERIGARRRTAITTAFLGHLARVAGRHADAVRHHERAGVLHRELGNPNGVAWSRYDLGLLARRRREADRAAEHLRAALSVFRDLDYSWGIACSACVLATVELQRGHPGEAAPLLIEALDLFEASDDGRGVAQTLEAAAAVACARADFPVAARLLGAASALRNRLAAPLPDEDAAGPALVQRRVRSALGPDAGGTAERVGATLPPAAALDLARAALSGGEPTPRSIDALTRRELEVARLVRQGRTNRQIGRALGITERTAEVHVHHILRKLGAGSRAEVAAWVAAGGTPPDPDH